VRPPEYLEDVLLPRLTDAGQIGWYALYGLHLAILAPYGNHRLNLYLVYNSGTPSHFIEEGVVGQRLIEGFWIGRFNILIHHHREEIMGPAFHHAKSTHFDFFYIFANV